ncbi:MAG: hypothetical protein K0R12_328 [Gammaproteobacteria bacterium]|jgi:aminoglycoside/choline kinase family phosphotransferase|nr:hypothetical protein [Gammaproteobacteria bacterium]
MSLPLPSDCTIEKKPDLRFVALRTWVEGFLAAAIMKVEALPKNAGFRRYFRLFLSDGSTLLAVDSPCNETDNNPGFVKWAHIFQSLGVRVPRVIASDLMNGFLLVEDLGRHTLEKALQEGRVEQLYQRALEALVLLQSHSANPSLKTLPLFDKTIRRAKLANCQTWFIEKLLNVDINRQTQSLLNQFFDTVVEKLESQPITVIHEDYQCRNLMVLDNQEIAMLDFQGAFQGAVAYDAASLLWDCYVEWPMERVEKWLHYYYEALCRHAIIQPVGMGLFKTWFYASVLQRHLKNTFIFARKYLRDEEAVYLDYLPRTAGYVLSALSQCDDLKDAHEWWEKIVMPSLDHTLMSIKSP